MTRLELLDGSNGQEFLASPATVLMLGKSDCAACAEWTSELERFLKADDRFGRDTGPVQDHFFQLVLVREVRQAGVGDKRLVGNRHRPQVGERLQVGQVVVGNPAEVRKEVDRHDGFSRNGLIHPDDRL